MSKTRFGVVLSILIVCTLIFTSCGGGGSSSVTSTQPPTPPTPPTPSTFTVTATAGIGTTITPSSKTVQSGQTATFTVGLLTGYSNLVVSGGGTLTGTSYTTGAINGNLTVATSATLIVPPSVDPSIQSARITPSSEFDFEFVNTPILIEVFTKGTGFSVKVVPLNSFGGITSITLNDNGLDGDKVAGDGILSGIFTPGISAPPLQYYGKTVGRLLFGITMFDNASGSIVTQSGLELGIVSGSKQVVVSNVVPGILASPNVVNVVQPYQFPLDVAAVTKKLYAVYPDVFDDIVIINSREDSLMTDSYTTVANDVRGIGLDKSQISQAVNYGSNGKLHGINNEGPNHALLQSFLHEMGHQYCCYLGDASLDLTRGNLAHFRAISTEVVGWLGNNQYLVRQADGSFLVVAKANGEYSELELYTMGLLPASAITPQNYILSSDFINRERIGNVLPASATTLVTINDIERVYGKRNPASTLPGKRVLFVVISEKPAISAEMSLRNVTAAYYASDGPGEIDPDVFPPLPFTYKAATKGRGTMVTAVPNPK